MTEPPDAHVAKDAKPLSPEDLFRRLDELGIRTRTVRHPAVFTVEQARAVRGDIEGGHTKNLFLRNKKGSMWLVVCPEDRAVDLQELARRLGSGRFSFCSSDRLMKYLGVLPGAVTPFAVVNDRERRVRVVMDRKVLENELVNFHPLDNSMTTSISSADLLRFLVAEGHRPVQIDLE